MRSMISLWVLVAFALFSGTAEASTARYSYTGLPLFANDETAAMDQGFEPVLPGYSGWMVIDETALPCGSLSAATITFSLDYPSLPDATSGLLFFDVFPFPATAGSTITFSTDADKKIVSWLGDFLDGPPDGRISSTGGDLYFVPGSPNILYSSEAIGTWAVVPIPPALPLALSGFAILSLLGKDREKKARLGVRQT